VAQAGFAVYKLLGVVERRSRLGVADSGMELIEMPRR